MININNLIERNKLLKILSLVYYGYHKTNSDFIKTFKPYIETAMELKMLELVNDNGVKEFRLTQHGLYAIDNDYEISRIDFVALIKRLIKINKYSDSNKIIVLLSIGLNIVGATSAKLFDEIINKITKPNLERLQKLISNRLVVIERGNSLDTDSSVRYNLEASLDNLNMTE